MISAYIPLYLASFMFVPAALVETFFPGLLYSSNTYKQLLDAHSAWTRKVNRSNAWAVFRLSYRSDATVSTSSAVWLLGGHEAHAPVRQSVPSTYTGFPWELHAFANFTLEPRQRS